ncbi:MAG: C69 family dipeptidase [Streptococcaceae bacterium]|nr:C69 family dipeptidase [Streptococcaceae bacterium]
MKKAMTKLSLFMAFVLATLSLFASISFACTSVYIGSDYTNDHATYFGRSEDKMKRARKVYGVQPASTHAPGEFYNDAGGKGGFKRPYPDQTYRFTYVRDSENFWKGDKLAYAEAGTNEFGLSVSATLSTFAGTINFDPMATSDDPSKNAYQYTGPDGNSYSSAGIAEYNLPSVLLGETKTAREAVQLLGSIIDTYGSAETYQVHIGDAQETWMFFTVSGHQWVAMKLNNNQVSVNPNMGSLLFYPDLNDSENCLHSADIEKKPNEAGKAIYTEEKFDIGKTYGKYKPGKYGGEGAANYVRYMQGLYYFNAEFASTLDVSPSGKPNHGMIMQIVDPPLFFTPSNQNMDTQFILNSLKSRGEGSPFSADTFNPIYMVSNGTQMETNFFQTRKGLPADIATIEWLCPTRSEFGFHLPSYGALVTEVADCFADGPIDHGSISKVDDLLEPDAATENSLAYTLIDIDSLCQSNRDNYGKKIRSYFDALQTEIVRQQKLLDEVMLTLPASKSADNTLDKTSLANSSSKALANQMFDRSKKVLAELQTHIKQDRVNGAASDFSPSDLNDDGTVKSPLSYAAYAIAPAITAQPQGATYNQNNAAKPLTTEASAGEGLVSSLTFEWFERSENGSESSVAMGESFTPGTKSLGQHSYFVRVTNEAGLHSDSEDATITIKKLTAALPQNNSFKLDTDKPIAGSTFNITATGDLQDSSALAAGDERYIPVKASASDSEVSFSKAAPYTAQLTLSKAGYYTLKVDFELQKWDGENWLSSGKNDSKSALISVEAASSHDTPPSSSSPNDQNNDQNSGQTNTKGSKQNSNQSGSTNKPSSNSDKVKVNNQNKLPDLGELFTNYSLTAVGILVLAVVIFATRKHFHKN